MQRQPDLLEVIPALGAPRRLACLLDGGQQQRDQDADDRDDYEKFYEREPARAPSRGGRNVAT